MALTIQLRARLPSRRAVVMSALPPPCANREPLTKSAPLQSAAMKRGSSAASVDPSASSITMMSPDAAELPRFIAALRSEEHTSELQSHSDLVCRLLLEKKKQ